LVARHRWLTPGDKVEKLTRDLAPGTHAVSNPCVGLEGCDLTRVGLAVLLTSLRRPGNMPMAQYPWCRITAGISVSDRWHGGGGILRTVDHPALCKNWVLRFCARWRDCLYDADLRGKNLWHIVITAERRWQRGMFGGRYFREKQVISGPSESIAISATNTQVNDLYAV